MKALTIASFENSRFTEVIIWYSKKSGISHLNINLILSFHGWESF